MQPQVLEDNISSGLKVLLKYKKWMAEFSTIHFLYIHHQLFDELLFKLSDLKVRIITLSSEVELDLRLSS